MILVLLFIGTVGVASVICALSVGIGIESFGKISYGKGRDPKNYYGTYYAEVNNSYYTFEIEDSGCRCIVSNGLIGTETTNQYSYEYVSSKYAQTKIKNDKYKIYDALFIYTNAGQDNVIVLWVTSSKPYSFILNSYDAEVTKTKYDFAANIE